MTQGGQRVRERGRIQAAQIAKRPVNPAHTVHLLKADAGEALEAAHRAGQPVELVVLQTKVGERGTVPDF